MKTTYEVEGCWTPLKLETRCRACGTLLALTPKTGHFNSKYWELARNDGTILKNCPKGCAETLAVKKQREYLKISSYCKDDSHSWKWALDYTIIKHAWIDRKGKVYPIGIREHIEFAYERGTTESILEQKGWLKLTSRDLMWEKKLSKKQIDFVFDYIIANDYEEVTKIFMEEYAGSSSGYFKWK